MMASQVIPEGSGFEQESFFKNPWQKKKVESNESNRALSSNRKMLTKESKLGSIDGIGQDWDENELILCIK